MRLLLLLFPWLAALLLAAPLHARPRVVAYVPNWIDLPAFAETIDYAKITHLNIAFENPVDEEGRLSFSPGNEALLAKARSHKVPVLVSIGGGSASGDAVLKARYAELLGAPKRVIFAASLAAYVETHGFAGVDVDIEGPSITEDYGPFMQALSRELKARGKQLTAALSQGYGGDRVPDTVFPLLDFLNIMAYDGAGYWDPNSPGQHSSLQFAKDNVVYWLNRGLPRDKAVLGVPFYGYGFGPAFRKRDYPFKDLVAQFPGAENADQAGDTIWYNGLPTVRAKAKWAREQRLGGVMIWSLDCDASGANSLLKALHGALTPPPGPSD